MSFAICRMQKMKSQSLKGIQIHNQRERESETNPNIDPEKKHLNYDLHNEDQIEYRDRVNEIISSEKTDGRKVRKDAVLVNELLVTSDRDFFDQLTEDEQKRYFKESYEFFKDRYGEEVVAYATVHYDEKTPHMHMGIVPIMDGKLQSKNMFDRTELRSVQNEFHAHVTEKGFDLARGIKSDRRHIEMAKFKSLTLQQENEHLVDLKESLEGKVTLAEEKTKIAEQELKQTQETLNTYKKTIEKIETVIPKIESIEEIETKETGWKKQNVTLKKTDFENVVEMAQKVILRNDRANTLQTEVQTLQKANEGLSEDLERERNQVHKYELRDRGFRDKISDLERENKNLVRDLTDSKFVAAKLKELVQKMKTTLLDLGLEKVVKMFEKKEDQIERERPSKQNEYENEM